MPVSDQISVFTMQLTGDAAETFLSEVKQCCPAPDCPHAADGRPRTLLPDELIERLKANSQRTFQANRTDYYEAWSDDTLALMKAKVCAQWVACSAAGDGEWIARGAEDVPFQTQRGIVLFQRGQHARLHERGLAAATRPGDEQQRKRIIRGGEACRRFDDQFFAAVRRRLESAHPRAPIEMTDRAGL